MIRNAAYWYERSPRLAHWILRACHANYEREMQLLDALCPRSCTAIDIGAKVGMYTYRLARRSSRVIAFEPTPLFVQMLERVFDQTRCSIEPFALSNQRGHATLRLPYRRDGGPEFGRSTIERANRLEHVRIDRTVALRVETRTLDEYRFETVGFIKIDVEGHELAVLEGAGETIAASRPNMLVECNDDHQPNGVEKLTRWLEQHDYTGYFALGKQLLPIGRYLHAEHWQRHRVENFICVHRSRPAVVEAVATNVAGWR